MDMFPLLLVSDDDFSNGDASWLPAVSRQRADSAVQLRALPGRFRPGIRDRHPPSDLGLVFSPLSEGPLYNRRREHTQRGCRSANLPHMGAHRSHKRPGTSITLECSRSMRAPYILGGRQTQGPLPNDRMAQPRPAPAAPCRLRLQPGSRRLGAFVVGEARRPSATSGRWLGAHRVAVAHGHLLGAAHMASLQRMESPQPMLRPQPTGAPQPTGPPLQPLGPPDPVGSPLPMAQQPAVPPRPRVLPQPMGSRWASPSCRASPSHRSL